LIGDENFVRRVENETVEEINLFFIFVPLSRDSTKEETLFFALIFTFAPSFKGGGLVFDVSKNFCYNYFSKNKILDFDIFSIKHPSEAKGGKEIYLFDYPSEAKGGKEIYLFDCPN